MGRDEEGVGVEFPIGPGCGLNILQRRANKFARYLNIKAFFNSQINKIHSVQLVYSFNDKRYISLVYDAPKCFRFNLSPTDVCLYALYN